ncbi:2-amino-4-hydroxy-6-hydroxymethyldihydropteridine diphosphokinase [Xylanibacter muris]|uniref:2-amino-4-hydroxy-6-hydroxymethyldihydropteridine pyrophosphokinase n=1 Tax=Xylanibacter muris TaxID=2736290 RepID=A0ABX2AKY1_9BACT|nr:2-amino-4-hydroxy-6-hydroxymethyldihydropteridine diphosphokinase [Xylanibacter muris]NPD91864.1 2-amino-4-hydroxy-6-hydroxymethyldihydropteridine diphosphokinase [Xylanibacter muris]
MHKVYLGLGSNLGNKEANICNAIERIEELIGVVERRSTLFVTKPWGFDSENMFVNAAVCCVTDKSPHDILSITQKIERELGRTSKSIEGHYDDRLIDIDILLYDDIVVDEPELKIPHPLMYERDFVMLPLKEIGGV